jgi:GDP-mannose 6-dehydrogenase
MAVESGARTIGLYGLAFKPGTDDLRESPFVELAERLIGKGRRLAIFDDCVRLAALVGGNKSYVVQKLPHLSDLLTEEVDDLARCELVLLAHPPIAEHQQALAARGATVIDLSASNVMPLNMAEAAIA